MTTTNLADRRPKPLGYATVASEAERLEAIRVAGGFCSRACCYHCGAVLELTIHQHAGPQAAGRGESPQCPRCKERALCSAKRANDEGWLRVEPVTAPVIERRRAVG